MARGKRAPGASLNPSGGALVLTVPALERAEAEARRLRILNTEGEAALRFFRARPPDDSPPPLGNDHCGRCRRHRSEVEGLLRVKGLAVPTCKPCRRALQAQRLERQRAAARAEGRGKW